MGFLIGMCCLFCNSLNGCIKVTLLPMVEMWEGWNSLSVNLHNKQVLPTPESPRSRSLNSTSYCLAMLSYVKGTQRRVSMSTLFTVSSSRFFHRPVRAYVPIPRKTVWMKQESMWAEISQERFCCGGGCGGLQNALSAFRRHPSHLRKWVEITDTQHHDFNTDIDLD